MLYCHNNAYSCYRTLNHGSQRHLDVPVTIAMESWPKPHWGHQHISFGTGPKWTVMSSCTLEISSPFSHASDVHGACVTRDDCQLTSADMFDRASSTNIYLDTGSEYACRSTRVTEIKRCGLIHVHKSETRSHNSRGTAAQEC